VQRHSKRQQRLAKQRQQQQQGDARAGAHVQGAGRAGRPSR
jgi:hypothetical protein